MVSDELPTVSALMWVLAKKHPEEFLEDPEDSKSVVRFTDLRKLALTALAKKCDMPEPQAVAEAAFQAWHDARHDVQELFFPGALDLLQELKARGLRLCAITNGNCDISRIAAFEGECRRNVRYVSPHLLLCENNISHTASFAPCPLSSCTSGVFEFCINAEKVGARKRTGRPYMAAIQQAGVGKGVGKRWVHIGDDFSEDILAAKSDFKLRTIWYHTAERKAKVEEEQLAAKRARLEGQEKENKDSSRTSAVEGAVGPLKLSSLASTFKTSTEPFFKDKAAVHVSTMETDDYLTHFITKEFVDGEVEDLKEIVPLIDNWVRQGKQRPPKKKAVGGTGSTSDTSSGVDCIEASQDKEESKFCIVCRAILPVRAKFCSACGEKQE